MKDDTELSPPNIHPKPSNQTQTLNLQKDDEVKEGDMKDDAEKWAAAEERDYSIYSKEELNALLHQVFVPSKSASCVNQILGNWM